MEHEWRAFPQTFKILEQQLSETLQQCQNRSVTEWASFFRKHGHDMDRNKQARLQMQSQVLMSSSSCPQHQESSVYTLASEDQLFQALDSLESSTDDNSLLVTMFHSHFEQSCVRAQYRFRKIAQHYLSKPLKEFGAKTSYKQNQHQQQPQQQHRFLFTRIEASVISDSTL
ncbi:hypothetical protein IV203_034392 [Nitzschia inconspicua]|uniref:Uncharacterized protein n=1 Tax=Nitzschia inconspicua TaxID=303405 RepID=A0A9K3P9Y7_9STRA|nr:hypothetical protein IV203_024933 [Nitzschia inconspicua]KAG7373668.1 hypothetical protein IV203_034392 [Nitzschia inconspicua]